MSPESNTIILLVFGVAIEGLFVSWLLNKYSNPRKTQWYVSLLVWFGWFFSFAIVFFIPMDVSSGRHNACHEQNTNSTISNPENDPNSVDFVPTNCIEPVIEIETAGLAYIWRTLYWTTYLLCWLVYPVLQSYVLAAHFSFHERLVQAIKENVILYATMGVIGIIFIGWLLITKRLHTEELVGVAMAAGNIYGLLLLFALLSYGLIEIPKRLWHNRNRQLILKAQQFQIVGLLEEVEQSKEELEATIKLVKKYSDNIGVDDAFRPFVDTIIKKCPVQYNDLVGGEGSFELSYDKIVALHSRVIYATMAYSRSRCMYEEALKTIYKLEDKIHSANNPDKKMRWSFKERKNPSPIVQILYNLEWVFYTYLESNLWIIASALCALLSISVVWSETTFWISDYFPKARLSIFYWLLNGYDDLNVLLQWIVIFVPCCYIAYCAYWSMFQLRILNYYRLIPKQQSDANSILFSAYYVCRLTAPMIYNFLRMIDDSTSAFYKVMGPMNLVPLLGNAVVMNALIPLTLLALCCLNVFNVYSWLLGCFCLRKFKKFVYDEDFSDERIEQGKDIIGQEKSLKERGLGLSIDQENGSLLNKNKKKKKSIFAEKFNFFKKEKKKEDKVELLDVKRKRREVV